VQSAACMPCSHIGNKGKLLASKNPNCPILASANHASTNEICTGRRRARFFEVPGREKRDAGKRLAALSAKGDPLEAIDRLTP
jgi:hypothetical protein